MCNLQINKKNRIFLSVQNTCLLSFTFVCLNRRPYREDSHRELLAVPEGDWKAPLFGSGCIWKPQAQFRMLSLPYNGSIFFSLQAFFLAPDRSFWSAESTYHIQVLMTKVVVTLLRGRVFNLEQDRGPRMIGFVRVVLGLKVPPSPTKSEIFIVWECI